MPMQSLFWTEFVSCPICYSRFSTIEHRPISLGCGHTYCIDCLKLQTKRQCPIDQSIIPIDIDQLPINTALLQLVITGENEEEVLHSIECDLNMKSGRILSLNSVDMECYKNTVKCISKMAHFLRNDNSKTFTTNMLSLSIQKKLVAVINCQLLLEEGRVRSLRAIRSLAERIVTELILRFQNPQQLSSNLWAAVRARGCQFLGPAMQEEVLKLVLLALENGSSLSRKVLVMFVVQRLEAQFPQASKTSIGHVVQLLYRASCFKVSKREGDSSLMQLKELFRTYEALRREHDTQIVQIAIEAGLRIAPDQWSLLLYGDSGHKSHMQSIIRKLQTQFSFAQSVQEMLLAAQRSSNPSYFTELHTHLLHLAKILPTSDSFNPTWIILWNAVDGTCKLLNKLIEYVTRVGCRQLQEAEIDIAISTPKYKVSLCHYLSKKGFCPHGNNCTFAHSDEELEKYRARVYRNLKGPSRRNTSPFLPNCRNKLNISPNPNSIKSIKAKCVHNDGNHTQVNDTSICNSLSLSSTTHKCENMFGLTSEVSDQLSNEIEKSPSLMSANVNYNGGSSKLFTKVDRNFLTLSHIKNNIDSSDQQRQITLNNNEFVGEIEHDILERNINNPSNESLHNLVKFPSNQFETVFDSGYDLQQFLKKNIPNFNVQYRNDFQTVNEYFKNCNVNANDQRFFKTPRSTDSRNDAVTFDNNALEQEVTCGKDRAVFIRSDSILNTDAGPYENCLSSPSSENKFGPIRPKYKGLIHTNVVQETNRISDIEHRISEYDIF